MSKETKIFIIGFYFVISADISYYCGKGSTADTIGGLIYTILGLVLIYKSIFKTN